jgi:hypothetical protein
MPRNVLEARPESPALPLTSHAPARSRDFYIDRLRSIMTAFVILHHTAITYGAIGGWFWYELKPSRALSSQLLIEFCTIVLVGVTVLLHPWVAPALVKFAVAGSLACAASWLIADPLVRMPGLRRIL